MLPEVDFLSKSGIISLIRFKKVYIETGNEIHFPLYLTCTMGIICFPLVNDLSDTELVQS